MGMKRQRRQIPQKAIGKRNKDKQRKEDERCVGSNSEA
jgi:hypothetical protein